jgi:AcrR family transcriptional regulator
MRKRAENVNETRQRITEAAMRLHTSLGPANTSISAVADEAGVTRLTVYRHFPDEEHLFAACTAHWAGLHPAPDPEQWRDIADREERARGLLPALYGWYRDNHEDLALFDRDFEALPASVQQGTLAETAHAAGVLAAGPEPLTETGRLVRAVAAHIVSFPAWHSLAMDQGLEDDHVIELAVRFLAAADALEAPGQPG